MRHAILCFLGLVACSGSTTTTDGGDDTDSGAKDSTTPKDSPTATDSPTSSDAPVDAPSADPSCLPTGYTLENFIGTTTTHTFSGATQVLSSGKDYVAVLATDAGCIAFDLLEVDTPITTNSFVFLTLNHYFDGILFHRVIDGFMAQTGDPNTISGAPGTWGTGGPGYTFGLEVKSSLNYDAAGVVGMARTSDPNSNGSQFFIVFKAQPSLNQQYTVFGKVVAGLSVLPLIVRGGTNGTTFTPPAKPTKILAAYIGSK